MTGAGQLSERIAFDRRATADDGLGNREGEWVCVFTVSAQRTALRGGEEVMAGRLASRQPFILCVRQNAQTRRISAGWRARHLASGDAYNIRTVTDPDGRRAWLDILCEAGVADG